MGNSKSRLKRSRSEFGSTRSIAFSLPSTWDRRTYAYSEPIRRTPSVSSSQSAPAVPKSILRGSANGGPFDSPYRHDFRTRGNRSRSVSSLHTQSLYGGESVPYQRRPPARTQLTSSQPRLTQHQYDDVYMKNDLKKVFRAQDRSNSVAQLPSQKQPSTTVQDSTVSLDERLALLRHQRIKSGQKFSDQAEQDESRREGATEKRIKSKKANRAPVPINSPGAMPTPKAEGKYRKKGPAPAPPTSHNSKQLFSSPPEPAGTVAMPTESTTSLLDEIEKELSKSKFGVTTREEPIPIPTPDYDMLQRYPLPKPAEKVRVKPPPPPKPKNLASVPPPKIGNREAVGKDALPRTATVATGSNNGLAVSENVADSTSPARSPAPKKQVREMATQYDAPVERATQCDGNTLRVKLPSPSSASGLRAESSASLAELLEMISGAARAADTKTDTPAAPDDVATADDSASSSDSSSYRSRNSDNQKIVRMDEVLAGVPTPPPLPSSNVKLLQRRTIKEDVPLSFAPADNPDYTDETSSVESGSPRRNFSSFQQELLSMYEKINKRRQGPSADAQPEESTDKSAEATNLDTKEASALRVFRHSETIMGLSPQTSRADTETDSGNEEPSDCGSSLSQSAINKGLPDFIWHDLAKSFPAAETDVAAPITSPKSEESKFNSIRRLKVSMRNVFNSISRGASKYERSLPREVVTEDVAFGNENWTFSGRTRNRQSILDKDTFSPQSTARAPARRLSLPRDFAEVTGGTNGITDSAKMLPASNMRSFSLLTPTGYHGVTKPVSHVSAATTTKRPANLSQEEQTVADIQL